MTDVATQFDFAKFLSQSSSEQRLFLLIGATWGEQEKEGQEDGENLSHTMILDDPMVLQLFVNFI